MMNFPELTSQNLLGEPINLPAVEVAMIFLAFEYNHYDRARNWFQTLDPAISQKAILAPILSNRFLLMKDALITGLEETFRGLERQTYPLFVDRIQFFDALRIKEENQPLIAHIEENDVNIKTVA